MQMMMIVIRSQMTTRFRCQLQCPKYLCPMFRLRSVSILSGVGRIRVFGATKSSTGVLFSPFKEFRLNLRKRRHSKFFGLRRSLFDPATSLAVLNIRSEAADPGGQQ